ncbi:DUF3043 domain-containing protein [Streptomyces sp. I05A-00742]|uniref:DUF3043 domain-containing protein n=1 Tax=Streptomyces sp. I05A-00742 TaxID=2732853 RepID=UPI0028A24A33|nr:DUF3043 domain-containing protein [Streptomyces sp. I05A-00742]
MFRSRSKEEQSAKVADAKVTADEPQQPRHPEAPKGRPTPKRSQASAQRRSLASTPANRKEAAKRQREARRADMAKQREALANGDERFLPVRDKGPVRRFVRDFVDSRFTVMEFFLPLAVVILVMSMINQGKFQQFVLLAWMVVILVIVLNSVVIAVTLKKALKKKLPGEPTKGAIPYALMRSLQMRRLRLPKPKVKRGAKP